MVQFHPLAPNVEAYCAGREVMTPGSLDHFRPESIDSDALAL
jgi:hypothetical protein